MRWLVSYMPLADEFVEVSCTDAARHKSILEAILTTICPGITHAKCSRTPLMSSASERSTRHSRKASMLRARSAAGTVEAAYAE